jgi:hypothetical protein
MIYVLRWVKADNTGTALACRDRVAVMEQIVELVFMNIPFSLTIQEVM